MENNITIKVLLHSIALFLCIKFTDQYYYGSNAVLISIYTLFSAFIEILIPFANLNTKYVTFAELKDYGISPIYRFIAIIIICITMIMSGLFLVKTGTNLVQ